MVYQCEKCETALPAGALNCPKCGEGFDVPLPQDAEVTARRWQPKSEVEVSSSATSEPETKALVMPRVVNSKDHHSGKRTPLAAPIPKSGKISPGYVILAILCWPVGLVWLIVSIWQHRSWPVKVKALLIGLVIATILISAEIINVQEGKNPAPKQNTVISTTEQANQQETPAASSQRDGGNSSVDHIGDIGVIKTGKGSLGDTVYIATTIDAFNKMSDAAQANDNVGFNQLLEEGSAFSVTEGTHAEFLGITGITLMHVRITDGTHATEDGWIPMEWLKKG